MKEQQIINAYEIAKERYAKLGIDTDAVMETLQSVPMSMHCWQADDVTGFESQGSLTGGIQATGNYPGKARNIEELRADILKAASYVPGKHRLNLHEIYGEFGGQFVDRDQVEVKHFEGWMQWSKENDMKLDFNSTSFSHPKSGNLSLSNPDKAIRDFWIEHTKRCRAIAEEMGKRQGDPCIMNLWVHDGSKDITVNRMKYRALLKDSLDQIFAQKYDHMKDCIESKVFGIGLESYTVGSNDFYIGYGVQNQKLITLDTGHFHPTEAWLIRFLLCCSMYGTDVACKPSGSLGLRPCNYHERRYTRFVQGNRTLQCVEPCSHRFGLLRCIYQPYRCVCNRYACYTEVPVAGIARTAEHAA